MPPRAGTPFGPGTAGQRILTEPATALSVATGALAGIARDARPGAPMELVGAVTVTRDGGIAGDYITVERKETGGGA